MKLFCTCLLFSVLANAQAPTKATAPAVAPAMAPAGDIKKEAVEKIASESTQGLCSKNMLAACFTFSEADCKAAAATASSGCVATLGAKQPASFSDKALARAYTKDLSKCGSAALVKAAQEKAPLKEECPLSK